MDKGAQKEVGRLGKFTRKQRHEYVDRMIASRFNGSVIIHSFSRMPRPPLSIKDRDKTRKTTLNEILTATSPVWLDEEQAQHYFNHLVSIVTKASEPDDSEILEGIHSVDEAYEQLFIAFIQMLPDLEILNLVANGSPDRLDEVERQLRTLTHAMDKRDAKTERALKLLLKWKNTHEREHQRDRAAYNRLVKR